MIAPTSTIGIKGTVTNDNAQAGSLGEFTSSVVLSNVSVTLTTNTLATITTISLSAGDWEVSGWIAFNPAIGTSITNLYGEIVATGSLSIDSTNHPQFNLQTPAFVPGLNKQMVSALSTHRVTVAVSATVYLQSSAIFTVAGLTTFGYIQAVRFR